MRETRSGSWTPGLTEAEQDTLFAIAEDTLTWSTEGGAGRFDFTTYSLTPRLKTEMATFVTLKLDGALRGCIGTLEPVAPLYRSIHEHAIHAALHDTRFAPVTAAERPRLDVHLSILSPMTPIETAELFQPGAHGIVLQRGIHRAVFLPEVAVEQNWSREETLDNLSMKAGLPPAAWRSGAHFEIFSSVALSRE